MASPYIVSRPMYGGGPPLSSQGPPSSTTVPFGSMGPLIFPSSNQRSYSGGMMMMPSSFSPPSALPTGSAGTTGAAATGGGGDNNNIYDDLPNMRGSPGIIILCIYILLVNSLFISLGRYDFNYVLYILGYHLWCIEEGNINNNNNNINININNNNNIINIRKHIRNIRQYIILIIISSFIDITFLFISFSTYSCNKKDIYLCFPLPQDLLIQWSYYIHHLSLTLSLINLIIKVLVIFLTFSWVQQQRKLLGITTVSRGTAMSPPQGPTTTLCG